VAMRRERLAVEVGLETVDAVRAQPKSDASAAAAARAPPSVAQPFKTDREARR
jgi:hypothetical protein